MAFFDFYTKPSRYLRSCWLQRFSCFLFWSISRSSIPPKHSGQGLMGTFLPALLQWQMQIWGQQLTPSDPGRDILVLYRAGKCREEHANSLFCLNHSRPLRREIPSQTHVPLKNPCFGVLHTKTWYMAKLQIASLSVSSLNSLSRQFLASGYLNPS